MSLKIWLALGTLAAVAAVGFHYRAVIAERDRLAADNAALKASAAELAASLETERDAARQAISDRADAQRKLDALRRGREADPEAQAWGAQPIPAGERQRLCHALPGAQGCPDILPSN
jgi:hypothetical protein